MQHDARGVPVTVGRAESLDAYEIALRQFQSYIGDPVATLDAALAQDPDFVSGHLMKALVLYTLGEHKYLPAVESALSEAVTRSRRANARERALMLAVRELADGEWDGACRTLDRVLIEHPRDALALQAGHLMDFFRGDALNLRNRITRCLPQWNVSLPGYAFVLGMHAFGLEEMNQYPQAEAEGRRALAIEPKDVWAIHAVAHVMEMQGRVDEGVAWLAAREADWAPENGFAFHNWWHLALFHLDGGRYDEVLALYDRCIHPRPSELLLSLVDATALLWRLRLEGVDVGSRFEQVADEWEAQFEAEAGRYPFNDFHAAMAFAHCGRTRSLRALHGRLAHAACGREAVAAVARDIGIPLVRGVEDFVGGRHADAVEHIEPVRDVAHRFGGSHAQRDLITLTLIEASRRAGDGARALHYIAERQVLKSGPTQWGTRLASRVRTMPDGQRIPACA